MYAPATSTVARVLLLPRPKWPDDPIHCKVNTYPISIYQGLILPFVLWEHVIQVNAVINYNENMKFQIGYLQN